MLFDLAGGLDLNVKAGLAGLLYPSMRPTSLKIRGLSLIMASFEGSGIPLIQCLAFFCTIS